MTELNKALGSLKKYQGGWERRPVISFADFLQEVIEHPERNIRNVYQVYVDMISAFVCEGIDEYINDAESIGYMDYNCTRLFVEGSDRPFFADRLFANRLMRHVDSVTVGAQQNKIYIFEGPHGSGKSTFLNNLLRKFEEYASTPDGARYEVVWHLKGENHHDERFVVPCPSHDHPLLIVPKDVRRHFFDDLFENDKFMWMLCTEK